MKKIKRSKLLTAIIVLLLAGGVLGIIVSFPFYAVSHAIRQGGVVQFHGVAILRVLPNSPAEDAGLQIGDEIISANGYSVQTPEGFIQQLTAAEGTEITITVSRDGAIMSKQITPRIPTNPTEGTIGAELLNQTVKKEPVYLIIPDTIIAAYSGKEETSLLFGTLSHNYQDPTYYRLKSLIAGIVTTIVGLGLWKFRRWAIYAYVAKTVLSLLVSIYSVMHLAKDYRLATLAEPLTGQQSFQSTITFYLIGLIMQLLIIYYLYTKRKLFR